MKLPNKKYAVIYADPPWKYKTHSDKGRLKCPDWKPFKNSAALHYETMSLSDICKVPVADICQDDCVLMMWVTMPMLQQAFKVIDAWGFQYKTVAFTWMKQNKRTPVLFVDANDIFSGTGYWTRANCELVLLATKGKPKRKGRDVMQAIFSPLREHSRKPDEIYNRIERLLDGPYCELFARTKRSGWDSVGDQTGKFSPTLRITDQRGDQASVKSKPRKGNGNERSNKRGTSASNRKAPKPSPTPRKPRK